MKRELIIIAMSAVLIAGCGTVPSAKNGKWAPANFAETVGSPRGLEGPTSATGARVATSDGVTDPAELPAGTSLADTGGVAIAKGRASVVAAGPGPEIFAPHRSTEIKNLALDTEP